MLRGDVERPCLCEGLLWRDTGTNAFSCSAFRSGEERFFRDLLWQEPEQLVWDAWQECTLSDTRLTDRGREDGNGAVAKDASESESSELLLGDLLRVNTRDLEGDPDEARETPELLTVYLLFRGTEEDLTLCSFRRACTRPRCFSCPSNQSSISGAGGGISDSLDCVLRLSWRGLPWLTVGNTALEVDRVDR